MIARFSESDLSSWHQQAKRKPLILRGARQVGKSTLVRMFCSRAGLSLHEINLERHPALDRVFQSMDMPAILSELGGILRTNILQPNSLLFLDEIQTIPAAIQALRYFYEEHPDLPVIAAGSLLDFALADKRFSAPVGRVEFLHLGPLSFLESLRAVDPTLYEEVERLTVQEASKISASLHRDLCRRQREYLITGGMPEALQTWLDTGNLAECARLQDSILATYIEDFAKYARHEQLARLQRIFTGIPRIVGQKAKYTRLSEHDRSREAKVALDLLTRAGVATRVMHTDATGLPLGAEADESSFKLLFLDVGLMSRMLGVDARHLEQLTESQFVNEGSLAEQFVGQQLLSLHRTGMKPALHYWMREGRSDNAEVDFIISAGTKIIPVEVKAGASGSLRSLLQFNHLRGTSLAMRFDLNPPSRLNCTHQVRIKDGLAPVSLDLISLPLYLAEKAEMRLRAEAI